MCPIHEQFEVNKIKIKQCCIELLRIQLLSNFTCFNRVDFLKGILSWGLNIFVIPELTTLGLCAIHLTVTVAGLKNIACYTKTLKKEFRISRFHCTLFSRYKLTLSNQCIKCSQKKCDPLIVSFPNSLGLQIQDEGSVCSLPHQHHCLGGQHPGRGA